MGRRRLPNDALDEIHADPDYDWVNTPGYSDYAVAGKPLHAVAKGSQSPSRSVCGLRRRLWSFDLFNDTKCRRCESIIAKRKSTSP